MYPDQLKTATLSKHPWGEKIIRILAAALDAVDPYRAVRTHFRRDGDALVVGGKTYHLVSFLFRRKDMSDLTNKFARAMDAMNRRLAGQSSQSSSKFVYQVEFMTASGDTGSGIVCQAFCEEQARAKALEKAKDDPHLQGGTIINVRCLGPA